VGLAGNFAITTSNLSLRGGLGVAALCAAATQSADPIHQMPAALNSVFTGHLNNMESAMGRRVRFGFFSRLSEHMVICNHFRRHCGIGVPNRLSDPSEMRGAQQFQRRVRLFPSARLNFSGSNVSTSFGTRGAWFTTSGVSPIAEAPTVSCTNFVHSVGCKTDL
jgi:hypothetical protein